MRLLNNSLITALFVIIILAFVGLAFYKKLMLIKKELAEVPQKKEVIDITKTELEGEK